MSRPNRCRLCLMPNTGQSLDIFSAIALKMKMVDILCEHFKCDITEDDALPNIICQMCWSTTDAFHELYLQSKIAQEKFLNSTVKTEVDPINIWPMEQQELNKEGDSTEETSLEIGLVKIEADSEESGSEDNTLLNYEEDGNEESDYTNSNDQTMKKEEKVGSDSKFEAGDGPPKSVKALKRLPIKQKKIKSQKLFGDNKHSLDFRCTECEQVLSSKFILKKHMQLMHPKVPREKNKQCDICKKMYASKSSLEGHLKRHVEKKESEEESRFINDVFDLTCDRCDAIFTSLYDARAHYKGSHNEEKGYIKCCGIKLMDLWLVKDHMKFHLNPESFKCDICDKKLTNRAVLFRHKRKHVPLVERLERLKRFACDHCGKAFGTKLPLKLHLFNKHVTSERKFECDACQKRFTTNTSLRYHVYSVHRDKPAKVTCELCGMSFCNKSSFDKHMLSHLDKPKPEPLVQRTKCDHCGEWLTSKGGLYYHQQLHSGEVQKCEQCDMEFPHRIALTTHIRRYHREHKHKCSYCDKSYEQKYKLKIHEESHTRHKIYKCDFCSKTFTIIHSLKTHVRRDHRTEHRKSIKQKQQEL